jgi:hypothetical protein
MIVVPVFMTSCHVLSNPKSGPVAAHITITVIAARKAAGVPAARAVSFAKWVKPEGDLDGFMGRTPPKNDRNWLAHNATANALEVVWGANRRRRLESGFDCGRRCASVADLILQAQTASRQGRLANYLNHAILALKLHVIDAVAYLPSDLRKRGSSST